MTGKPVNKKTQPSTMAEERYTLRLSRIADSLGITWDEGYVANGVKVDAVSNQATTTTAAATATTTSTSTRKRIPKDGLEKNCDKSNNGARRPNRRQSRRIAANIQNSPIALEGSHEDSSELTPNNRAIHYRTASRIRNNPGSRKSQSKLFVSDQSPILLKAEMLLSTCFRSIQRCLQQSDEDTVKYALLNAIKKNDVLESIHILSRKNQISVSKLKWPRNDKLSLLLSNHSNYPMNITLVRNHSMNCGKKLKGRGRPRRKVPKAKRKKACNDEPPKSPDVISILSSSSDENEEDDEGESEKIDSKAGCIQYENSHNSGLKRTCTEAKPMESSGMASSCTLLWKARPDPIPLFQQHDWVVIPLLGAGEVISPRIDRLLSADYQTAVAPLVTYKVRIEFGTVYAPSSQLSPLETSEVAKKVALSYQGITLRQGDLVRLWPDVYINDSIVNFYLRYLQQTVLPDVGTAPSLSPPSRYFVYPSYFYTRISSFSKGKQSSRGTAKNTNGKDANGSSSSSHKHKQQLQDLWESMSSWTKNTDILAKSFLIVPINYRLHWSFVMVCNPGALLECSSDFHKTKQDFPIDTNTSDASVQLNQLERASTQEESLKALNTSSVVKNKIFETSDDLQQTHDATMNDTSMESNMRGGVTCKRFRKQAQHAQSSNNEQKTTEHTSAVIEKLLLTPDQESARKVPIDNSVIATPIAESKKPCILHFDSGRKFRLHRSPTIFNHIRKYLSACLEFRRIHKEFNSQNMPGFSPLVPQQPNETDCGLYMLEMIEGILQEKNAILSDHFIKNNRNSTMFQKEWLKTNSVNQKRQDIKQLIYSLSYKNYRESLQPLPST